MKIQEIKKGIFYFEFPDQYSLAASFMRLQEFYESPFNSIRGKYFTIEKYMDLYAASQNNQFDYFTKWQGFNIPGKEVNKFIKLFYICKNDLNIKETKLIKMVWKVRKVDFFSYDKKSDYYIIATHKNLKDKKAVINHELAHGLYKINESYRNKMNNALFNLKKNDSFLYNDMKKCLLKEGYTKHVINDEIQAYFSTSTKKELIKSLGIKNSSIIPQIFKKNLIKYF